MSYSEELTKAMTWLGTLPNTVFIGQQVRYPGNGLYATLCGVSMDKRIEVGVAEDMQMGLAIGMALAGKLPICIFPRMDFLLCACNQLVNHLEKYPDLRVIVRTCVGSKTPLDPGPQHSGDYTEGLQKMLKNVVVTDLKCPNQIYGAYAAAAVENRPHILVERGDLYRMV